MADDNASTDATQGQQEPGSTGAEADAAAQAATEAQALQDEASKGAEGTLQEQAEADAAARAKAKPDAGGEGEGEGDAAEAKAKAEADAAEKQKADEAAEKQQREEQSKRDSDSNLRQLQRRATNAEQRLLNQDAQRRQEATAAEKAEWDRKRDSEDPAERDQYNQHKRLEDARAEGAAEIRQAWPQAEQQVAAAEYQHVLSQPFFKDSGVSQEELNAAMQTHHTEVGGQSTYGSLINAAAAAVVAKNGAALTEAQGELKEANDKITSLTVQLTDAGIAAAGSPPRSPNGDVSGGALTPESYAKKLAAGEQPTAEEIDAMTAAKYS